MRLINPRIERPYFLKPINDKKLKIEYTPVNPQFSANNFGLDFVSIDLYRQIGVTKHQIYHICVIPINIDADARTREFLTFGPRTSLIFISPLKEYPKSH